MTVSQAMPATQPTQDDAAARCRACGAALTHLMVDLGMSPLCESFLPGDRLDAMEPFYPLRVFVCDACRLVQLREYVAPEAIFDEYAYFSSYSDSWVAHARDYVAMITDRLGLDDRSFVVELASNDGYLLRHFVERGTPCLGIEPARNVATAAMQRGIPTLTRFFGVELARELVAEGRSADLIVGNNVLAQVPNVRDFLDGAGILLAPGGTVTMEFPHLLRLLEGNQFDTIYHEHFSYFSMVATVPLFARSGLSIVDVEEIPTHGGSLRIYAQRTHDASSPSAAVRGLLARERDAGLDTDEPYRRFREQVERTKRRLLACLSAIKEEGKSIVAYGAPGKGNTLLNYCGIRTDFLDYAADRNPFKHGRYLPGTHIPVVPPERIAETRPDYILILPWNIRDEIIAQLAYARAWGAKFIVPIPEVEVL